MPRGVYDHYKIRGENHHNKRPENRTKISFATKEAMNCSEVKEKCRLAAEKHWQDPEFKAAHCGENNVMKDPKVKETHRISMCDPEYRANQSVVMKKRYADPAEHEKTSASLKGNKNNYIDGRSRLPYDSGFNEFFKESIRTRDKVCQLCGKTKEQNSARLSVHHCCYGKITQDDVFVALCKSCNGKVNKKSEKDYWTKFFVARMLLAA